MKPGRDYVGVGVGAMVFNREGRVFLARRGPKASNERGTWEFPGGKVSFGEKLTEAVTREFAEEYAMVIETTELLGVNNHILPDEHEHWVSPTYLARHVSGEPRILEPEKCSAIGWFHLDELPEPLSLVSQDDVRMYREKMAGKRTTHVDGIHPQTDGTTADEQFQVIYTEEQLQAVTIGELAPLTEKILVVDYDPAWPQLYEREAARVRDALAEQVVLLEHAGSTSVPGLAAKPRIDMLLVVPDSADEAAYVPALEAAGYVLRIREPGWYEHRLFNGPDTDINLHVFSPNCAEVERMLLFRDWLRAHDADRQFYESTKRDLARRDWKYVQNYADAKTKVVEEIIARASESSSQV
ncbi:MAG TPA: GrpB family protein [Ktedonobacteraceae bacterium]